MAGKPTEHKTINQRLGALIKDLDSLKNEIGIFDNLNALLDQLEEEVHHQVEKRKTRREAAEIRSQREAEAQAKEERMNQLVDARQKVVEAQIACDAAEAAAEEDPENKELAKAAEEATKALAAAEDAADKLEEGE